MHGDNRHKEGLSVTERLGEQYGYKGQRQPRGPRGGSFNRRWVANEAPADADKQSWYKIMIPYGQNAGKDFILNSLSELLDGGLQPHQFQFERGRDAVFYVCTNSAGADALSALHRRVTFPTGFKMSVIVRQTTEPPLLSQLDDTAIAKMKVAMSNKYNVDTKALDMSSFCSNAELRAESLFLPVNRLSIMRAVTKIIEENIPELVALNLSNNKLNNLDGLLSLPSKTTQLTCLDLSSNDLKSASELDKIKTWQLTELSVSGNPFASQLKPSETLASVVRKRFPKLVKLNGDVLPPSIGFDVADGCSLPKTLGSTVTTQPPEIQSLLACFLEEYLQIYDSAKRDPLIRAYHEEATFSCTACHNRAMRNEQLTSYFSESRNLLRVREEARRKKLLRQGPLPILAMLITLPKTSHWLHTFNVDVLHASQSTIIFNVTGLFEEVLPDEGRTSSSAQPCVRAFSRLFVTVPQGSGIVIANEQLSITNATPDQVSDAIAKRPVAPGVATSPTTVVAAPAVAVSSPPGPAAPVLPGPDVQQAMVAEFSRQSGMNIHWSTECLNHNEWNFEKAAAMFTELKSQGKIPSDAFL